MTIRPNRFSSPPRPAASFQDRLTPGTRTPSSTITSRPRSGRTGTVGLAIVLAGTLYAGSPSYATRDTAALAVAPDVKLSRRGELDTPAGLSWSPNAMAVPMALSGAGPAAHAAPELILAPLPPLAALQPPPAGIAPRLAVSSAHTEAQRPEMSHLPQWVQVTDDGARLFASPDDDAFTLTHLAPHTFLRVQGARDARLMVRLSGDAGGQG